jgi:hypothetical protein
MQAIADRSDSSIGALYNYFPDKESVAATLRQHGAIHDWPAHSTVRVRALLVPPLVQPTSPTFPLGVITLIVNCPGPEITPVVSIICSCCAEFTVAPRGFPLITISDAETKLLPLTLSSAPCCT